MKEAQIGSCKQLEIVHELSAEISSWMSKEISYELGADLVINWAVIWLWNEVQEQL